MSYFQGIFFLIKCFHGLAGIFSLRIDLGFSDDIFLQVRIQANSEFANLTFNQIFFLAFSNTREVPAKRRLKLARPDPLNQKVDTLALEFAQFKALNAPLSTAAGSTAGCAHRQLHVGPYTGPITDPPVLWSRPVGRSEEYLHICQGS